MFDFEVRPHGRRRRCPGCHGVAVGRGAATRQSRAVMQLSGTTGRLGDTSSQIGGSSASRVRANGGLGPQRPQRPQRLTFSNSDGGHGFGAGECGWA